MNDKRHGAPFTDAEHAQFEETLMRALERDVDAHVSVSAPRVVSSELGADGVLRTVVEYPPLDPGPIDVITTTVRVRVTPDPELDALLAPDLGGEG